MKMFFEPIIELKGDYKFNMSFCEFRSGLRKQIIRETP